MNYSNFVAAMDAHPDSSLSFRFSHGPIRPGYHVTEVMSAAIESVDCGGRPERRREAVLQLLETRSGGDASMPSRKAASILRRSEKLIPLSGDAEVVLELRPEGSPAAQRYTVGAVELRDGLLVVEAAGATTQCKPALTGDAPSSCGGAPKAACCS